MKHNSLKFLFIAASISIGLSSCDGYLDQMPSNALPSDESINNCLLYTSDAADEYACV